MVAILLPSSHLTHGELVKWKKLWCEFLVVFSYMWAAAVALLVEIYNHNSSSIGPLLYVWLLNFLGRDFSPLTPQHVLECYQFCVILIQISVQSESSANPANKWEYTLKLPKIQSAAWYWINIITLLVDGISRVGATTSFISKSSLIMNHNE